MTRIILLLIFIAAFSGNLRAQEIPSQEEMLESWHAYMMPGEMHKMISKSDGVWLEEVTIWTDPSGPPTKNKAKATNRMIFGGRYQESKHVGSFGGMPFEGLSTLSYDNAKKMFQSTWIDNMGTGIMFLEGTWDDATKTIHFKGKSIDPMSGKEIDVREEYLFIDTNNQKLEMYMTMPGMPEMKSMEITLKRIEKAPSKK